MWSSLLFIVHSSASLSGCRSSNRLRRFGILLYGVCLKCSWCPLLFCARNHDKIVEYSIESQRTAPAGAINLHRQVINHQGYYWLCEGSLRYRVGPYQYTHSQMWDMYSGCPWSFAEQGTLWSISRYIVTHSRQLVSWYAWLTHQGIKAFRVLIQVFRLPIIFMVISTCTDQILK